MSDTFHRVTGTASADWIAAAGNIVGAIYRVARDHVMRHLRTWQTARALMSLSDTVLKDIGLTRSEIASIAHGLSHDRGTPRHAAE